MILWKNIENFHFLSLFIILIPTPDFPHFYYMLGGNLGSLLYGGVSVMSYLFIHVRVVLMLLVFMTCLYSLRVSKNDNTFNRISFLYYNLNWYAFNINFTGNQYPSRVSN